MMTTAILIENKTSYVGVGMLYISGYWWLYGWLYKCIFTKIIKKNDIGHVVGFSNSKGRFWIYRWSYAIVICICPAI